MTEITKHLAASMSRPVDAVVTESKFEPIEILR